MSARPVFSAAQRQKGVAAVEFQVVVILVLIPVLMLVLQLGMLVLAKNTVNVAALAAARAGAATGGDRGEMNRALAIGLAPLYSAAALNGDLQDLSNGGYFSAMTAAVTLARVDVAAGLSRIDVLNPTSRSFTDFGVMRNGVRQIPVTGLETNNPVGARSAQRRSDALLLKVEVQHCYRLVFPVVSQIIIDWTPPSRCGLVNAIPITSQAVVRMTVPPLAANFPR